LKEQYTSFGLLKSLQDKAARAVCAEGKMAAHRTLKASKYYGLLKSCKDFQSIGHLVQSENSLVERF